MCEKEGFNGFGRFMFIDTCKIGWWVDGIMNGNCREYRKNGTKIKGWYQNNKRIDDFNKSITGVGRFWKMKTSYFQSKLEYVASKEGVKNDKYY